MSTVPTHLLVPRERLDEIEEVCRAAGLTDVRARDMLMEYELKDKLVRRSTVTAALNGEPIQHAGPLQKTLHFYTEGTQELRAAVNI